MTSNQRLNAYLAHAAGLSRRRADQLIEAGKVEVDGQVAKLGRRVSGSEDIRLAGKRVSGNKQLVTIILNKPEGYISSRRQQGDEPTIYDLLPLEFHELKPAGRLDKDSSGLLLLTNDGQLIYRLTHPSFEKEKRYEIELDQPLTEAGEAKVASGVELEDGISRLQLHGHGKDWTVTMHEGRNRQIRRTFDRIGYRVTKLHRFKMGDYWLPKDLRPGEWRHLHQG